MIKGLKDCIGKYNSPSRSNTFLRSFNSATNDFSKQAKHIIIDQYIAKANNVSLKFGVIQPTLRENESYIHVSRSGSILLNWRHYDQTVPDYRLGLSPHEASQLLFSLKNNKQMALERSVSHSTSPGDLLERRRRFYLFAKEESFIFNYYPWTEKDEPISIVVEKSSTELLKILLEKSIPIICGLEYLSNIESAFTNREANGRSESAGSTRLPRDKTFVKNDNNASKGIWPF